ncbi:MAG: DUF4234 domain-containing protein [Sandaracinaceae bacterium]
MKHRHPAVVVLLSVLTFGLYALYWLYQTTRELKEETDREDLHPMLDVLLVPLTFGLWGIWATYRNAGVVHDELLDRGESHVDRSLAVALFSAMSVFASWFWLVSIGLLQQDYNQLASTDELRVRFERYAEDTAEDEADDDDALYQPWEVVEPARRRARARGGPEVFRSDAPAPHVF